MGNYFWMSSPAGLWSGGGPRLQGLTAGKRALCVAAWVAATACWPGPASALMEQNWGGLSCIPPLLRSCPRTGLLSIGMLLIGNRWSLADWASRTRQAGGHTCIHNHTYILTHCHSQSPIHTSKHKHKYTPTNTPSHSLENTTHKPSVTRTHKSHK